MAGDTRDYINLTNLAKLNGLQFVKLNARSLFPKLPVLTHSFITESMDIVGFTETWFNINIPNNLVNIPGFNLLRNDRIYSRGGHMPLY